VTLAVPLQRISKLATTVLMMTRLPNDKNYGLEARRRLRSAKAPLPVLDTQPSDGKCCLRLLHCDKRQPTLAVLTGNGEPTEKSSLPSNSNDQPIASTAESRQRPIVNLRRFEIRLGVVAASSHRDHRPGVGVLSCRRLYAAAAPGTASSSSGRASGRRMRLFIGMVGP
jgi:hypothetical protein